MIRSPSQESDSCIAVVVAVFNSPLDKVAYTLASIAVQRGVAYEVVIADDGSEVDEVDEMRRFLLECGLPGSAVRVARAETNGGTVVNVLQALDHVSAPYVKLISPGDGLYGEGTLREVVERFEGSGADIVFGRAVHYRFGSGLEVFDEAAPAFPGRYDAGGRDNSRATRGIVVAGDNVLGASIAYRTEALRRALSAMEGRVRYVEDNTSLAYVLAHGGGVSPLDSFLVWYERGEGVSTCGDDRWSARLAEDYIAFWRIMAGEFPGERMFRQRARRDEWMADPGRAGLGWRLAWKALHPVEIPYRLMVRAGRWLYKCEGYDLACLLRPLDLALEVCGRGWPGGGSAARLLPGSWDAGGVGSGNGGAV